ncbi:hypothetical protein M885DRAFT_534956 [Pelagophyceae sp. CCMP2097]|nr:hypothetical protein M885DRAFT_534956 [Pelagophyceae sp. CCMP2097]
MLERMLERFCGRRRGRRPRADSRIVHCGSAPCEARGASGEGRASPGEARVSAPATAGAGVSTTAKTMNGVADVRAPLTRSTVASCVGLLLAVGLSAAMLATIGLIVLEFRRREVEAEDKFCGDAAHAITAWGQWLFGEAYALGAAMTLERASSSSKKAFLLAGHVSAQTQFNKMAHMQSLGGGAYMTPSIIWRPTVLDADRADYEDTMTGIIGFSVTISNVVYEQLETNPVLAAKVPAPRAAVYHPMTSGWSVIDDAVGNPAVRAQGVGSDVPPFYGTDEQTAAILKKVLVERRIVAHTPYVDLVPVSDALLLVEVPFCGLGECADEPLVGVFTFVLAAADWAGLFPANLEVRLRVPGTILKTVDKVYSSVVHAHEPFFNVDLRCYYDAREHAPYYRKRIFGLIVCCAAIVLAIVALLLQDYRERRLGVDAQSRLHDQKVAAEYRELQRIHAATLAERFAANERMERYVNHEIKNRLVVLSQLCSDEAQLELVAEMAETLNEKMVLVRLSSSCYKARLDETVDLVALVDRRLQRYRDASCPFVRTPTMGAAAGAASALRLDALLVKIVFDNILSNAFKYGSATRPPSLTMHLEPDGCARVSLVIELTNWAGREHAALLTMGEAELNRIAGAEGERAHTSTAMSISSGDGFPMAVVAARALGGTLRLRLSGSCVVAHLELSKVAIGVTSDAKGPRRSSLFDRTSTQGRIFGRAQPVDPSQLTIAIVDDSPLQRKVFKKHMSKIAPRGPPVILAGDTMESIDEFARVVCDADVDVVFTDQHFSPVHHTKAGTDIVREIRALDAAAGRPPRLIFVASGNDSPEDAAAYLAAGADGSLSKISSTQLRHLIELHATTAHPRFQARVQLLVEDV